MKNTWTAYLQQDGDNLVLPLPDEVIEELGWKIGDTLVWDIDEETGVIKLSRKQPWWKFWRKRNG